MNEHATRTARATSDAELVGRMAAGDLDGLGMLFDAYSDDIRRFILRMGVREGDADDLVQNAFLAAARSAGRFNSEYTVRAWLFGIAAMMVRRHRRSVARLALRLVAWSEEPRESPPAPDGLVQHRQQIDRLREALEHLAPKKREAFVLVALEGIPGEQAARALGVPVNTIWTRLHHARRELRQALESEPRQLESEPRQLEAGP